MDDKTDVMEVDVNDSSEESDDNNCSQLYMQIQ